MTTAYSFSDTLGKDSGGQKLLMGVDLSTSQLDFCILGAIGAQTAASKIYGHLLTGGGMVASAIKNQAVGMPLLLGYLTNPSGLAIGGFQLARGNQIGHQYVVTPSATALVSAASQDIASAASAVVYSAILAACGVQAGACAVLLDGTTSRGVVVFGAANETVPVSYGTRGVGFATNVRYEIRNTVGVVNVTIVASNDSSA